jgi:hypothetical protein
VTPTPPHLQSRPTGDRRAELERIKVAMWPPDEPEEQRRERIARNVAAIEGLQRPDYSFEAETWKYIAESPGVYED